MDIYIKLWSTLSSTKLNLKNPMKNLHFQCLVPSGVEGLLDGLGLTLVGVAVVRDQLDFHVRVAERI